jgi:hypothetical protein
MVQIEEKNINKAVEALLNMYTDHVIPEDGIWSLKFRHKDEVGEIRLSQECVEQSSKISLLKIITKFIEGQMDD